MLSQIGILYTTIPLYNQIQERIFKSHGRHAYPPPSSGIKHTLGVLYNLRRLESLVLD